MKDHQLNQCLPECKWLYSYFGLVGPCVLWHITSAYVVDHTEEPCRKLLQLHSATHSQMMANLCEQWLYISCRQIILILWQWAVWQSPSLPY